jgi:N-dimethylarginine dimethylaminohydrolase
MPARCPRTRAIYEAHGIECFEVDVSEYIKAAGALGCLTGILRRE